MILGRMKPGGLACYLSWFLHGALFSHAYNQLWADQKTYARYWSQQVPNLKSPYCYLAEAYREEGSFKESRKYYRLALKVICLIENIC